ncbi:MAG: ABC transporter ATP-binding protein [Pseudomonadota bacterium]
MRDPGHITRPQQGLGGLIASVRAFAGARLWRALLLVALGAVFEGLGLVLLLPIAELLFIEGDSRTGLSAMVDHWLAAAGAGDLLSRSFWLFGAFLLLLLLRAAVLLKRDLTLTALSQGYVDHLRVGLMRALVFAEWRDLRRTERAHMMDGMTTDIARVGMALRQCSQLAITFAMITAFIIAGFAINPVIGAILVALAVVGGVFARLRMRSSRDLGRKLTGSSRAIADITMRFLAGLKAAKVARGEADMLHRFQQAVTQARTHHIAFTRQQGELRRGVELLGGVGAMVLFAAGYGLLGLSGAEILLVGAVILRLMPSLTGSLSGLQMITHSLGAFDAAMALRASVAVSDAADETIDTAPPVTTDATLNVSNASVLADPGDGRAIVAVSELTLPPHGLTLVTGPSGGGKSTLVDMLSGLLLPDRGHISLGTLPLTAETRAQWQRHFAYAPQEPFLFQGTVRDNLCWPERHYEAGHVPDDDALWAALDKVRMAEVIRALPDGLDQPLWDGGTRLSGGERQRLCLARALLDPAPWLIVDEGLSALDPAIAAAIVAALGGEAQKRGVVVVAHNWPGGTEIDRHLEVSEGAVKLRCDTI